MSRFQKFARLALAVLVAFGCLFPACPARALDDPQLTEAKAAFICDQAGNELWSLNPDEEMAMASVTKVMTAIVALDSGFDMDKRCTITKPTFQEDAQMAGFEATDKPTFSDLMMAMLVFSGNDAAYNVATNVSGSEKAFVEKMNEKAKELGMNHTHFMNTHGLEEDGHYSCVRDLVTMGRYALQHYPFIAKAVQTRSVEVVAGGQAVELESTDDLMETYEGLLGIKTGTVESGTTFLGASKRGNIALFTSVLGCETDEGRFSDTAALMDWAYENFSGKTFGREGWVVRVAPYALGFNARAMVSLGADQHASTWPDGEVTFRRVCIAPDVALDLNEPYSCVWWRQGGRFSGGSKSTVDSALTQSPSVNILSRPLFVSAANAPSEKTN